MSLLKKKIKDKIGAFKAKPKKKRSFRSGSVDADKNQTLSLGSEEAGARPRSYSSTDSDGGKQAGTSHGRLAKEPTSPMTASELHDSVLSALSDGSTNMSAGKASLEKKVSSKQKPKGMIEYEVKEGDTLVKIGAMFEVTPSELIKINRLLARTVFVGQTLFLPDPNYVPNDPPTPLSPQPDTRPKVDVPLPSLKDGPMPSVPGHAVLVSSQTSPKGRLVNQPSPDEQDDDSSKFLKGPARRVMEEVEGDSSLAPEGIIVKGTLLVTPNAIMFDPDVNAPPVSNLKDTKDITKFGMVVYMEDIKSVALFHDISPRMFWRQPQEIRANSPKPEPYRLHSEKSPLAEGDMASGRSLSSGKPASDSIPQGEQSKTESDQKENGRTSVELEGMTDMPRAHQDSPSQQGRASEEVENTMTHAPGDPAQFPLVKQMSRSSELEVSEMALLPDSPDGIGETRDFGPHMGRSSSEVHRHTSSSQGRVSDSSPGDASGRSFSTEAGDSNVDSLGTPTQGFSPLHFTDRSPKSVLAHPKPISGQRAIPLSPAQTNDLKSQKILEDPESNVPVSQAVTAESDVSPDSHDLSEDLATLTLGSDTEVTINPSLDSSTKSDSETKPTAKFKSPHLLVDTKQVNNSSSTEVNEVSRAPASGSITNSPLSTFSPAQQLSNIFSYTSNMIQKAVKTSAPALSSLTSLDIVKGRAKSSPLFSGGLQLKSGFTKEDMEKIFGPDPKEYLQPTDSPHFEQPPLYLQIRPGIKKEKTSPQPTAFEHRNCPLLEEYWLVVPRQIGDKLYTFLTELNEDMYGDQEETQERERLFYDIEEVRDKIKPLKRTSSFRSQKVMGVEVSTSNSTEVEKSWEILSKEEVYSAEKSQALNKEDTIDESNLPELIGQTQFLEPYHILSLLKSLPRNMTVGYNWELTYATHKHGYSLQNLYQKMENVDDSPVILFIRDTHKCIFGAFMSHLMKPSETFYGAGSTFLFTFYPEFKKFFWRGDNQFFMYGTKDSFAIGSGEGLFGLWLDGDLNKGRSHECSTFYNDVLTKEEDFVITDLEVWRFVDSSM